MSRLAAIAFATLVLASVAHEASASYCQRPHPPRCATSLMLSSQAWEFDDCRERIERFQREVRAFVECQRDERETVIRELNEEIRQFNACASNRYC